MDRFGAYLIHRLQRRERMNTIARVVNSGVLARIELEDVSGRKIVRHWPLFDMGLLSGDDDHDRAVLADLLRIHATLNERAIAASGVKSADEARPPVLLSSRVTSDSAKRVLRLIRDLARPPSVYDIVAALLIARAIRKRRNGLASIRSCLARPTPIVTLLTNAPELGETVLRFIENGTLLRTQVLLASTSEDSQSGRNEGPVFGDDTDLRSASLIDRTTNFGHLAVFKASFVHAAQCDRPVIQLGTDRGDETDLLAAVSDVCLRLGRIDWDILTDTVNIVLGTDLAALKIETLWEDVQPRLLTPTDLALAIRPGRSIDEVHVALARLSARQASAEDGEDDVDSDGEIGGWTGLHPLEADDTDNTSTSKPAGKNKLSSAASSASTGSAPSKWQSAENTWRDRNKDGSTGSEIITPVPVPEAVHADGEGQEPQQTERDRYIAIETLSGYGEARDWALDLKADLALWRDGKLGWDAMNTRLLLSGPPGTGKTTFARALCNTLQIPLLVTSVSTWLEPSHLGAVIKRMRQVFEEAQSNAPVILFIDEIDGIGQRQDSSREYADYWNGVVNKALELLDGAVKSQGVIIVGATNRPAEIDAALLRSGRLERQIEIPLPDVDALVGIYKHHLGADLAHVVETAPSASGMVSLANGRPRSENNGSADQEARALGKGPSHQAAQEAGEAASQKTSPALQDDDNKRSGKPPKDAPQTDTARKSREQAAAVSVDHSETLDRETSKTRKSPGRNRAASDRSSVCADTVLRPLAIRSLGYSGADIERLVRDVRSRVRREGRRMTYADLDVAIRHGKPEKSPEFRRIVAVHEAGHAVLRHMLDEGTTEFISIDATPGGVTISAKRPDAVTEDRMERWLIIHLAGRAAEEVIIGSVTSGSGGSANSDLAQATALAVAMETALGFGEKPLMHLNATAQSQLLWAEPKLAARVYDRLERAYAEGCRLVSEHRERIERLAAALLATGTLDADTVRTIIADKT